ncbi:hypothetical protein [Variovorax sp. GT1P44]|uniref:hypothetical protein n=1 Tax=Variovorax sp. GT1P44 TaxID=3443742 RepID=UPI003F483F41
MAATIDTDRLFVLLDRGEAAVGADHQARAAHTDALLDLRDARAELQEAEILARARRALHTPLETLRANVSALEQRAARRAAALPPLARRANLWVNYTSDLRALAKKHGVTTA